MQFGRSTYRHQSRRTLTRVLQGLLFLSLSVLSVAPAQFFQITDPKDGMVSRMQQHLVRATGSPGAHGELWLNGEKVRDGQFRIDGVIEFIAVPFPIGNVEVEVRVVTPNGIALARQKRMVHILGTPVTIGFDLDRSSLRADGSSTLKGTITLLDEWGYQIMEGYHITLLAEGGTITSPDINANSGGVQRGLESGVATFEFRAGTEVGTGIITAKVNDTTVTIRVPIETPLEPFTLVGLVNGSAASMSGSGDKSGLSDLSDMRNGLRADGRMSVYARGTIGDDYLLTASFDSDRRDRSRLFRELDPDYLYSIYGDNSMLHYDVQTNTNLFARIEKNRSYATLGEFGTDLAGNEFTRYQRALNGVKVGHEDDQWALAGFGALTDRRAIQREIRGEGISGFYMLQASDITIGSERVRIEVRDKFQSHVVLKEDNKFRYTDYDIDYLQGTIFFKQPVPAMDAQGNPVWIVVTFEAKTGTASSVIAGGSAQRKITDALSVGLTAVLEEQEPSNYSLLGSSATFAPDSRFRISGEVARSNAVAGSGLAYKVETSGSPADMLSLRGYYRAVEAGFLNITQAGGRRELGTEKYGVGATATPTTSSKVTADWYQTLQEIGQGRTRLTSFTGSAEHAFDMGLSGLLKVEDVRYATPDSNATAAERHSTLITGSTTYRATDRLRVTAQHEQNIGSATDATTPSGSSMLADYKVTDNIVATGSVKLFEAGGAMSSIGLRSTVFEGTEVYGKYEIGNAIGGKRNMMTMGLKNTIELPYDLRGNFAFEHAKDMQRRIAETPTQDHTALSAGLEYLPAEPYKASTKVEFGDNTASHKVNITLAGDIRLEDDLSLVMKYRRGSDRSKSNRGYQVLSHLITGLAYRPVSHNNYNVLAKFEVKNDDNRYVQPYNAYSAMIASVHAYAEPVQRMELGIKYAFRVAEEETPLFSQASNTNFILLRGTYDITSLLDAGIEYRALMQAQANDILSGYSLEVGYVLQRNLRLVAGYNFKGYKDRDLIDAELSNAGPFMKVSFKFGEDLFGLGND